jgi:hypothetical protein
MDHNEIHFRTARCILCLERINRPDKALPSMSTLSALCIHMLNQSIATDNPHAVHVVKCPGGLLPMLETTEPISLVSYVVLHDPLHFSLDEIKLGPV